MKSSFYKEKGAKLAELLKYLIGIVFRHTNIYLDTKYRKQPEMSKNTIYRFLSSTLYDWCKLLYLVAINVIAFIMLKSMYRVYYTYKGQDYTLNDLFREAPRNRRHSAVISSVIVKIHNSEKSEQYARIVFLKSNNGNDWIAILSTNLTIPDTEIVRLYSKRWNIEVLFKFCKHCLKLDTELECRSFEALYAHTTIVFLRYIMLAFENRVAADDRTCFADTIKGSLAVSNSQIDIMISVFIALIPQFFPVS